MRLLASSCLSVCPSAWNDSAPTERIFTKTLYFSIFFENLSRKFKLHQNLTRIKVLYMKTDMHFLSFLARLFLEGGMLRTKVVENIKTHKFNGPCIILVVE